MENTKIIHIYIYINVVIYLNNIFIYMKEAIQKNTFKKLLYKQYYLLLS